MNVTVKHGERTGTVTVPPSKSAVHRSLICAALSEKESRIACDILSKDIKATMDCLNGLGAEVSYCENAINVLPIRSASCSLKELHCGESGSTLRFLIPIVGALKENVVFLLEGRLPERPNAPLIEVLAAHGMEFKAEKDLLYCQGELKSGDYRIRGDISSQYISGLLFALPLLNGDSILTIEGKIESADYIKMTESALKNSGISFVKKENVYYIEGGQQYNAKSFVESERDWSSAAFFLCMGALSENGVTVKDMATDSPQGDKMIIEILKDFGAEIMKSGNDITVKRRFLNGQTIDAGQIPDLVPVISAVAAVSEGQTVITNAKRLLFKESDRLKTTKEALTSLGADISETEDGLVINGKQTLLGGISESFGDHRIAMTAAVAASRCINDVTVKNAECTEKSFANFWQTINGMEVN